MCHSSDFSSSEGNAAKLRATCTELLNYHHYNIINRSYVWSYTNCMWNLTFDLYSPSNSVTIFPVTVRLLVDALCQPDLLMPFTFFLECVYMNGYLKWEKLIYFVVVFFIYVLFVFWCQRCTCLLSYNPWQIQKVLLWCLASAGWPIVMLLWTFVKETFVCMP